MLSWSYGTTNSTDPSAFSDWRKIVHAPEVFAAGGGHRWIASPGSDGVNVQWWARAIKAAAASATEGRSNLALGFIDTSWVSAPPPKDFGDLHDVSECGWNIDHCLDAVGY